MRYVGSRSFKVIEFGINRTGIYDFLLATDNNFGYVSHVSELRRRKLENRISDARHDPLRIC